MHTRTNAHAHLHNRACHAHEVPEQLAHDVIRVEPEHRPQPHVARVEEHELPVRRVQLLVHLASGIQGDVGSNMDGNEGWRATICGEDGVMEHDERKVNDGR